MENRLGVVFVKITVSSIFLSFVLNKFWYEVLFVKYIHVITVWVSYVGLYCDSYKVGGLF